MKILFKYIRPYRPLVLLAFVLAAINQTFSLFDPMIFGKLIDGFAKSPFKDANGVPYFNLAPNTFLTMFTSGTLNTTAGTTSSIFTIGEFY